MNLSRIASGVINRFGEPVVILHRSDDTTNTVNARVQPLDIPGGGSIKGQGGYNVNESETRILVFPSDTRIEDRDRFQWNGWEWEFIASDAPRLGGDIAIHVTVQRVKAL